MKLGSKRSRTVGLFFAVALLGTFSTVATKALAQDDDNSGYKTSENSPPLDSKASEGYTVNEQAADKGNLKAEGPVRMARFSAVVGNVTFRPESSGDWSQATDNMPLRQGAEILVLKGGRADLQFDDGSSMRLGNGAYVILKTLYSDTKGEFTQVTLKDGLATMRSRHADSVFEVDTPIFAVRTTGAARIRLGVDGGSEVAVQRGNASIDGPAGKTTIAEGNYMYMADNNADYDTRRLPGEDSWDKWNDDRDKLIAESSETYKHVPSNIGLVSEDLDGYGTWHDDAKYGWVWAPNNQGGDWRPYNVGHWVWVEPYGWTWVSSEPWGWAPYHYGTWCRLNWGWSWCPGSRFQYWSPGVVSFCSYGGNIGWAPLCPWEVVYPSYCGLGIWGADWCLNFSIGWAGCYYPFHGNFCEGRRFDNHFVNNFRNGSEGRFASQQRFNNSLEARGGNNGFVPFNARNAAGATTASTAAFGGRGTYQAAPKGGGSVFSSGRAVVSSSRGVPVSGPSVARPTDVSRTANRSFVSSSPLSSVAGRSTFNSERSTANSVSSGRESASSLSNSGGGSRVATGGGSSAAEAARQARASIGYSGGGQSGFSRSGSGVGYSSGSTRSGGYSGGDVPRSTSNGGGSSSSGRNYSGPSGGQSYRIGPSYQSGGGRSSGGSSSSGGSRSGGGGSSGGGGGGRSAPSGGGRH